MNEELARRILTGADGITIDDRERIVRWLASYLNGDDDPLPVRQLADVIAAAKRDAVEDYRRHFVSRSF